MFALPFLHGLNFMASHQMTPFTSFFSLIYLHTLSKIISVTESNSLPMAEGIWKKKKRHSITLTDMTLNSWLLFWSIALRLPNFHVVLPLSIDSPLLVTVSHVLFCLRISHTFSPMFMVICPTLLRKVKLSKDNFQTVSILSFLPASAPIFSHFSLLVQMSYWLS